MVPAGLGCRQCGVLSGGARGRHRAAGAGNGRAPSRRDAARFSVETRGPPALAARAALALFLPGRRRAVISRLYRSTGIFRTFELAGRGKGGFRRVAGCRAPRHAGIPATLCRATAAQNAFAKLSSDPRCRRDSHLLLRFSSPSKKMI